MSSARGSHGTFLKIGDGGGSEVFTTIAEVLDIDGPGLELATEEVTNHDSSGRREYIGTLLDSGEVSFAINYYSAATQDQLITDQANKTVRNFQIVFPLSSPQTWSFGALITAFQPKAPVEGALTADCTLKATGAVTIT